MPDSIATMTDQQHIERAVQRTVGKMARDVLRISMEVPSQTY